MLCLLKQFVHLHFTPSITLSFCNLPLLGSFNTWLKVLSFLFGLTVWNLLPPGHRNGQMAKTGEDDVLGPGWKLQARIFFCTLTLLFSLQNLTLHLICFKTRQWETAKRTTRQVNAASDGEHLGCEPLFLGVLQGGSCLITLSAGVGIIALLKRTLHKDCVVMVKQFRPPLGCHTLEFPAGQMFKCWFTEIVGL